VETHPYSLFLSPGDHFWQSYEENQLQKIFCRDLPYDFEKKAKSTFVPGFLILPNEQYHNRRYPTVRLGAPAKLKYLHSKSAGA
jgi:hypothetical protein